MYFKKGNVRQDEGVKNTILGGNFRFFFGHIFLISGKKINPNAISGFPEISGSLTSLLCTY